MNIRQEIARRLEAYRVELRQSLSDPEHRAALLQLLRCVDYGTFLEYIRAQPSAKGAERDQIEEVSQLFGWGLNEALQMFWSDRVNQPGVPLFPSSREGKDWGDSLLQCCGRIRLIEHALELERIHLGTITHSSQDCDTFDFHYAENATGVESVERKDSEYFNVLIARFHQRNGIWEGLRNRRPEVMARMEGLVGRWEQNYIRYGALPVVDEYYHDLAAAIAPTKHGWDAFPRQSTFGGIQFAKYIDCVRVLLGFALKHLDFCVLLCSRHPEIDPMNVVTVPCKWSDACCYMAQGLGIPETQAQKVMLATSLTPENANHHFKIPAGPVPCHYMIGQGSAVRFISGCLHGPFHFMLRELRRQFPSDWDSAVNSREDVFRRDLAALLLRSEGLVFFTDNIEITTSCGKTDIDAFAFDPGAGVVGLFQLKWQEPFGSSIRERESRKTNFLQTGNEWVEKTSRWIVEGKMSRTLVSLGIPKNVVNGIRETRLFVLGRNFSHFSGDFKTDARAAWGSWPQLLRLVETKAEGKSPLTVLFDLLKADGPPVRSIRPRLLQQIKVGPMTLRMHPFGSEPDLPDLP